MGNNRWGGWDGVNNGGGVIGHERCSKGEGEKLRKRIIGNKATPRTEVLKDPLAIQIDADADKYDGHLLAAEMRPGETNKPKVGRPGRDGVK